MMRSKIALACVLMGLAGSVSADLRFTNVGFPTSGNNLNASAYDGISSFTAVGTNSTAWAAGFDANRTNALSTAIAWSQVNVPLIGTTNKSLLAIAYGSGAGKFLAGDLNGGAYTSGDGTNWLTQSTNVFGNKNSVRGFAYNITSHVFVAVSGGLKVAWNSDALTTNWNSATTTNGSGLASFNAVTTFGASSFAACGLNDYITLSTDAGKGWNVVRPLTNLFSPDLNGIASDGGSNLFAVGAKGRILYSSQGGISNSWNLVFSSHTNYTLNSVAYLNPGFITVGTDGTNALILTITNVVGSGGSNWIKSVNGTNANGLPASFTNTLRNVTVGGVGNLNKVVVIVGDGGTIIIGGTPPTAAVTGTNSICNGSSTNIQAALGGSVGPWDVTWTEEARLGAAFNTNFMANVRSNNLIRVLSPANSPLNWPTNYLPNVPTNYLYTVTSLRDLVTGLSANPTDLTGGALITVNPRPTATLVSVDTTNCNYGSNYVLQAQLTGTSPWIVTWNDGSVQSANAAVGSGATLFRTVYPTNSYGANVASNNVYYITNVVDANSCVGNQPGDIIGTNTVTVNPRPTAMLLSTNLANYQFAITNCNYGLTYTITNFLTGVSPWTVTWNDGIVQSTNVAPGSGVALLRTVNPTNSIGSNFSSNNVYYIISVVDANGCAGNLPVDILGTNAFTINPRPTATIISLDTTNCNYGFSYTIRANLTGLTNWNVTWWDGAVSNYTAGAGNSGLATRVVYPTNLLDNCPVTTAYWIAGVSNINGCFSCGGGCTNWPVDLTGTNRVTVNPRPKALVTGTNTVCNGQPFTFTLNLKGQAPWTVQLSDGSTLTVPLGNVTNSGACLGWAAVTNVTRTPTNLQDNCQSTSNYFVLSVTDASGCVANKPGDTNGTAKVTINPRPKTLVTGTTNLCNGQSFNFTINLKGQAPWTVQLSDGSQLVVPAGNITNNGCFGWAAFTNVTRIPTNLQDNCSVTTNYFVTNVVDSSGCSGNQMGDTNGAASATVNPRPKSWVVGTNAVCNGSPFSFQVLLKGQAPWTVQLSDGSQLFVPNSFNTNFTCLGWAAVTNVTRIPANSFSNTNSMTNYFVVSVVDLSGCAGNQPGDTNGTAIATVNPRPMATLLSTNLGSANFATTICNYGTNSYTITNLLTGVGVWTVTWNDGLVQYTNVTAGTNVTLLRTVSPTNFFGANAASNNIYYITNVMDTNSCFGSQPGDIRGTNSMVVNPRPTATLLSTNLGSANFATTICNYGTNYTIANLLTGVGVWTVTWNDGLVQYTNVTAGTNVTLLRTVSPTNFLGANAASNNIYYITNVMDTNSCFGSQPGDIRGTNTMTVNARPTATLLSTNLSNYLFTTNICNYGTNGYTIANLLTGVGVWTVTWNDGLVQYTNVTAGTNVTLLRTVSPTNSYGANAASNNVYYITSLADTNLCFGNLPVDIRGTSTITVNPRPTATNSLSFGIQTNNIYTANNYFTVTSDGSYSNSIAIKWRGPNGPTNNAILYATNQLTFTGVSPWTATLSDGHTSVTNHYTNSTANSKLTTNYVWIETITNSLPGTNFTFSVSNLTDGASCMAAQPADLPPAVSATINGKPTADLSISAIINLFVTVCSHDSVTMNIDFSGMSPWTNIWSDGYSNVNYATPATRLVMLTNYLPDVPTNYFFSITNLADGSGTGTSSANDLTGLVQIQVDPLPAASPTNHGDLTNCIANPNLALSVSVPLNFTADWYSSSNIQNQYLVAAGTNIYTPTNKILGAHTFYVVTRFNDTNATCQSGATNVTLTLVDCTNLVVFRFRTNQFILDWYGTNVLQTNSDLTCLGCWSNAATGILGLNYWTNSTVPPPAQNFFRLLVP